jgi:surface antigen
MKMTFKYNFIKSILGSWPVILGLAFTFFTHFSFAEEVLDEQVYSNLTEQELEAATVNLVLALETLSDGDRVEWQAGEYAGYVIPSSTFINEEGYFCREYLEVFQKFSEYNMYQNKACRDHDGEWVWLETIFTE